MNSIKKITLFLFLIASLFSCKENDDPKGSGLSLTVNGKTYFYKLITSLEELNDKDIVVNGSSCFTSGCFNTYRVEPSKGPFDQIELEINTENSTEGIESLAGNTFTPANDEDAISLLIASGETVLVADENAVNDSRVFSVDRQIVESDETVDYFIRGEFTSTYVHPDTEESFEVSGSFEFPAFVMP